MLYSPSFEDSSILTTESNDLKLKVTEQSLLIEHSKTMFDKADTSNI